MQKIRKHIKWELVFMGKGQTHNVCFLELKGLTEYNYALFSNNNCCGQKELMTHINQGNFRAINTKTKITLKGL